MPSLHDLAMMTELTEASMIGTLRARFEKGAIYSSCGDAVLVAINPYEQITDYSREAIARYHRPGPEGQPPHIFHTAAAAYAALSETQKDQSILISGESGAGKTEATKHTLSFLAEVRHPGSKQSARTLIGVALRRAR